ncbi:MAG TPA: diguanylate cyclase [Candidatus Limnocylindrales bacterium]|nr:diguanylate cyclase [Candidatus Limnocylindrales bacterium]
MRVAGRLVAPTLLLSKTGRITYVKEATESLFRQQPRWLIGRTVEEFVHEDDRRPLRRTLRAVGRGEPSGRSGAFRVRGHPALDWRVIEWTADNLLDDPDVGAILVSLHDVTGLRAETATLADLAFHDALTGLPNRNRLVEALSRLVASDTPVAIGLASIDRLDLVEDSLGQVGAEALIRGMAKRIRAAVPVGSLVGRAEGGSFSILLAGAVARDAEGLPGG